jgi:hypothetical protein
MALSGSKIAAFGNAGYRIFLLSSTPDRENLFPAKEEADCPT